MLFWVRIFLALCIVGLAGQVWAQSPQRIEGTSVMLEAPKGFTQAKSFSGLENLETSSSIMIVEMPKDAYPEISSIFQDKKQAKKQFASRGVKVSDVTTIELAGQTSPLLLGSQKVAGNKVDKYIVVSPHHSTIMITFNVFGDLSREDVYGIIDSTSILAKPPIDDQLKNIPFSVDARPPFIYKRTLGGGIGLTPFEGIDRTGLEPKIIVVPSLASMSTDNLRSLSETLIRQTAYFHQAEILNHSNLVIDGQESIKSVAKQDDKLLYHYVLPTSSQSYIRLIGMGAENKIIELEETIDEIAKSVSTK